MSFRSKVNMLLEVFNPLLPDSLILKIKFRMIMGQRLHLRNPQTFNEKIQWIKLHDRNVSDTALADKYAVKDIVGPVIGWEHVIPTIGVWDSPEEMDSASLPERFVLKCTHDSGSVVICRDRKSFDMDAARKFLSKAFGRNFYRMSQEWIYKDIRPRIIAEPFLDDGTGALTDYKFFCFDGEPRFLYVSAGLEDHSTASISFVNMDWTPAPYQRSDYRTFAQLPPKPEGFDSMVEIARKLSEGHRFLRVDLYQVGSTVYFSELTFYPNGGFIPFANREQDLEMGRLLEIFA